ncbi:MAG: uracil-DNA glycosylase [Candidatus Izemoplasmatales bacterium]
MKLNKNWKRILSDEIHQPYFKELMDFVCKEYKENICYPDKDHIFKALNLTAFEDVKVLILGQDPYHQPNQAMGLAFSVPKGVKLPPSLKNIYKELTNDLNIEMPDNGDLTPWAKQGVLLMNAIFTVRKNEPLSHKDKGWEMFSDSIISLLNQKEDPIVFVLWGSFARTKKVLITNKNHLVIENVHPSPLAAYRGFFGAKPFSKINQFLIKNGRQPINFKM